MSLIDIDRFSLLCECFVLFVDCLYCFPNSFLFLDVVLFIECFLFCCECFILLCEGLLMFFEY